MAKRTCARFRCSIEAAELEAAFERIHRQPRALLDLVFLYVSSEATSLGALIGGQWAALLEEDSFERAWAGLRPLHQRICQRIAHGSYVSSAEARREYGVAMSQQRPVSPGTVYSALRSLQKAHVLARSGHGRGVYQLDDPSVIGSGFAPLYPS